jgi:site-specific DNA-methyltransferase (adenine-specific)
MAEMEENSIDAVVSDPPYGLSFMGKNWDRGVPGVPFWEQALRVLKPGGYLLAFGGSRTYHRLACAVEDAGFEIRDQIMWLYGSGFPKSLNLGKQDPDLDGFGTALKPAHEPIVMARKPFKGTVAANVLEYGTGAINVDGCRVEGEKRSPEFRSTVGVIDRSGSLSGAKSPRSNIDTAQGRFPANVIHDGSPEVLKGFPDTKNGGPNYKGGSRNSIFGNSKVTEPTKFAGSSGSAARYFYCAKTSKAERNKGCDALEFKSAGECTDRKDGSAGLTPRAGAGRSSGSRNNHPTVKPIALMRYLCRLVTPPGGTVLDPFMGSGSTGVAALAEGFRFEGIELNEDYLLIAAHRIADALEEVSG